MALRSLVPRAYTISFLDEPGARLIAPENPVRVTPGETVTTSVFVVQGRERFADGERRVRFRLNDGDRYVEEFPWRLLGPVAGGEDPGRPAAEAR
jgi:hypothetical protein